MALLLVAAGGVFTLLFIINLISQTLRQRPKIGFWHTLLAFLATLLPITGLSDANLDGTLSITTRQIVLLLAAIMIVASGVAIAVELRRPQRLKQSRGVLGIGVGMLLLLSAFSVPMIAENIYASIPPSPTLPIALAAEVTSGAGTMRPSNTPFPTFTPTLSPAPLTNTPFSFATNTPEAGETSIVLSCEATTIYNINLRAEPYAESALVGSIAFNTTISLLGRNADSSWWAADYRGRSAWIRSDLLNLNENCAALPIQP